MSPLLRTMRPGQWVKNFFVLAPLVFAESLLDPRLIARTAIAFVLFCALSSAVYLLNDLLDRERDRQHPLKRHRPLAAGTLQPATAIAALLLLAGGALAAAAYLGRPTLVVAVAYLAINLAYSMGLKHVVILDAMAVSSGYLLRVLVGGYAAEVPVSTWLLLCTTFLALFLTFSKRRHELTLLRERAAGQRQVLSEYSPEFLDQLINVVTASSLLSYALWAVSDETRLRFGGSALLVTLPFVLFGIFRYLYLIYRTDEARNPTEAMLRDAPFVGNLLLWGLSVLLLLYGPLSP
ncbi:MAG: decaprenyl-phosphate phosphoribosyltransferase [Acidobacteria bacterium]|nr:MAG: decaprenyl-phosphate phosphoribosyltransferase [Acidobacteriota bacterium]